VGVASETRVHLETALRNGELRLEELQELVMHFAVYVGWALGRQLDDLLLEVGEQR
jgi:4-carboxymuconolactone decarboxylase